MLIICTCADWVALCLMTARQQQAGSIKMMVKKIAKYVPLVGSVGSCCEYMFLDRNVKTDQKTIVDTITGFGATNNNICVIMFPEGAML
jgi:1-acyl-sn-glycerol-3-phosphate acyltransferase